MRVCVPITRLAALAMGALVLLAQNAGAEEPLRRSLVGRWIAIDFAGARTITVAGEHGAPALMFRCGEMLTASVAADPKTLHLPPKTLMRFRFDADEEHRRFVARKGAVVSAGHADAAAVALLLERNADRELAIDAAGHHWRYRIDGIREALAPLRERCAF